MAWRSPEVKWSNEKHENAHCNHCEQRGDCSFLKFKDPRLASISYVIEDKLKIIATHPNPSAVSIVFRNISEPKLSSKWWKAKLYSLNIFFPSLPLRCAGALAASTGSETKLKFSLRFDASVQSGMCGCKSVKTNFTEPSCVVVSVRGERGVRPLELTSFVKGEEGVREESWAFRSFSMNGVGPPAPAQKSTYV